MVWDGWNPLKDLVDEWRSSRTVWGKLKVILFYSFVWNTFFESVYLAFMPWSMSMDCLLATSSKQKTEIAFVTRQYALFAAAWLLYVAKGKTHLPNMRVLVAVVVLSNIIKFSWEGNNILGENGECSTTWFAKWWLIDAWPILAMILAYVERHVDNRGGATAGETQALV